MYTQDTIYKQNIIYHLQKNYIHELIVLLHRLLRKKELEYNSLNEYEKAMYDYKEICFLEQEIELIYKRLCVLSNDLSNDLNKEGE
jgi:hypothetical protein